MPGVQMQRKGDVPCCLTPHRHLDEHPYPWERIVQTIAHSCCLHRAGTVHIQLWWTWRRVWKNLQVAKRPTIRICSVPRPTVHSIHRTLPSPVASQFQQSTTHTCGVEPPLCRLCPRRLHGSATAHGARWLHQNTTAAHHSHMSAMRE